MENSVALALTDGDRPSGGSRYFVRQAAQHSTHQPPGAGAGIGPRLRQRAELASTICLTMPNGSKVLRARRAKPRHCHHVAVGKGKVVEHLGEAEYSALP
jgi:hypothetical protein